MKRRKGRAAFPLTEAKPLAKRPKFLTAEKNSHTRILTSQESLHKQYEILFPFLVRRNERKIQPSSRHSVLPLPLVKHRESQPWRFPSL